MNRLINHKVKSVATAVIVVAALAATTVHICFASSAASEYEVKAAYMYNFGKFIDWPADAFTHDKAPIVIGILGKDPFGPIIDDAVRQKTANGRRILIKRYRQGKDIDNCHMLFVGLSEENKLDEVFIHLKNQSVLTVGEGVKFIRKGGIIRFNKENGKVVLEISLANADRAGLRISSKLLKVAKVIKDQKE